MSISVGQKAQRTLQLTADHVKQFAELSGDYNPPHFDPAFCGRDPVRPPRVQGGLTTGVLHALVAMDLPGPGTVFLSQNWKIHGSGLYRRHDNSRGRGAERAPEPNR
jgi:acyl dehydratase